MPFIEDELGAPVVEFGQGDVFMFVAEIPDHPEMQFVVFQDAREPGPIGVRPERPMLPGTEECETCMETKLKLAFNKVESIDQVLIRLFEARHNLQGIELSQEELEGIVLRALSPAGIVLNHCLDCGRIPQMKECHPGDEAPLAWVQCKCGRQGESYHSLNEAAQFWNDLNAGHRPR